MIKEQNIQYIDLQFGDMFGTLHHTTYVAKHFDEEKIDKGIPFDGSSIRAWKSIDKSDMMFKPDPDSAFVDPFRAEPTLVMFGDVYSLDGTRYDRAPRNIVAKALEYMKSLGIGDQAFFGPEPEFFIFDDVQYQSEPNCAMYSFDSVEAPWNMASHEGPNLGHKIRHKAGYFPVTPQDTLMDLRSEIVTNMQKMNMVVDLHHHEVATAGQCEIGIRYGTAITAGDITHMYKYAVKNTCFKNGKTATFMPKPMFKDNGSGMHSHVSIWKGSKNGFVGNEYGGLSKEALYAIGGLLKHGRAIQAFTNPSLNSYRRLVPGYEAPVRLAYSATNRSAAIRIPHVTGEKAKRFEFRCPDASGSPYLVYAAMLMAMIDGITKKIDPGPAMDKNIYELPPEEAKNIPMTCGTLDEAIAEFDKDRSWLTAGGAFSNDMIDAYLDYKKAEEIEPAKLRPNPWEFVCYYDC
jgi:glutamine synthetase